jgi:hypothetical protein
MIPPVAPSHVDHLDPTFWGHAFPHNALDDTQGPVGNPQIARSRAAQARETRRGAASFQWS